MAWYIIVFQVPGGAKRKEFIDPSLRLPGMLPGTPEAG